MVPAPTASLSWVKNIYDKVPDGSNDPLTVPREIENNAYAKFWGKHGVFLEMRRWRMEEPEKKTFGSIEKHLVRFLGFSCFLRYQIMLKCWHESPMQRPSFEELVKEFDAMLVSLSDKVDSTRQLEEV